MFPEIEADLSLAVKDLAERDEPVLGRVLKFDYEKGCHVLTDGRFVECTPVEAVCQYIEHILRTELDKYKVYTVEKDEDFGISVYKYIGQLDDDEKIQPWINRIAANLAVRSSMEKRPLPFSGIAGCKGAALAAEETVLEDPAVVVFRREIIRMTMEVLRELPGKQRAALWMVYGMNLSIKEAAIKLKVPENTVKSRLFRGRQRFLERSEAFVEMGVFLTPAALPSLIAMAFAGRELFGDNLNQY